MCGNKTQTSTPSVVGLGTCLGVVVVVVVVVVGVVVVVVVVGVVVVVVVVVVEVVEVVVVVVVVVVIGGAGKDAHVHFLISLISSKISLSIFSSCPLCFPFLWQ